MRGLAGLFWAGLAIVAVASLAVLALHRGETVSAMWLVAASACTFFIAHRFYSRYVASAIGIDPARVTPAHRRNEPMYLRHIVEELARDRGESFDAVAAATSATARAFFRLPAAAA